MPDNYPDEPGFKAKDTETSQKAANQTKGRADLLRNRCFEVLSKQPATADEVAKVMNESVLSVRPRFSELKAKGKIVATNLRRKNESGSSAVVWTVALEQGQPL